jgi:hypothetical protein
MTEPTEFITSPGIISLLSTFSVDCVLSGRVSLAHLIEFSHFVDLYVLEDRVYFERAGLEVDLEPFWVGSGCPLVALPEGAVSWDVFTVSNATLMIYDAAPIKHTFSLGSYDYWLALSDRDRAQILRKPSSEFDSMDLHYQSRQMDLAIRSALENVGKTRLTLMPSSRNLIPFMEAFHELETPALMLYREASSTHREQVESLLSLVRPRSVYLPPLLSVLLARCQKRDDIPTRLVELRAEFAELRFAIHRWLGNLDEAKTLREKLQLRNELSAVATALTRRFENKRRAFYREVAGALVDALEDGDPRKLVTKPVFTAVKHGVTSILPDAWVTRRFTGLIDLLDEALQVEDYSSVLHRLFGDSLDISQAELTEARRYRQLLATRYGIESIAPT